MANDISRDISWRRALGDAIRANPQMSVMLGLQLGLMLLATTRAKRGRAARVPPAETVLNALPALAASTLLSRRR